MGIRLFFSNGADYFQIFSINQNAHDSSIYFSSPKFEDIKWHLPAIGLDQQPVLVTYQIAEPGKLSVHGSGIVHAKAFGTAGSNDLAIRGSILKSADGSTLSVRHLLTILPAEPRNKPTSPFGARKTDVHMTAKQWLPYVLVFFAIPLTRSFTVTLKGGFDADDIEGQPDMGFGGFNLETHAIVCLGYRTKHMERWPANSQACYSDGHAVPLFFGTEPGRFRVEYRRPSYSLEGDEIGISL